MNENEILYKALLIRKVEEKFLSLFADGTLTGTVHTCIGQELSAVCIINALSNEDAIFSTHRSHGHFISWTNNIEGLIAEVLGKSTGVCGGNGGTQNLHSKGFYSSGIQGGLVPIAAGLSLVFKFEKSNRVVVNFIGDGTLGQGIFYETMNIASLLNLPLLIVVENNGYAQSTAIAENIAGSIKGRADAFDIRYMTSSTWDYENLVASAIEAINYVRENNKPLVFEVKTYRLAAHSKSDDYRNTDEIANHLEKDFISQRIKKPNNLSIVNEINTLVEAAVIKAVNAPLRKVISPESVIQNKSVHWEHSIFPEKKISDIIYLSLKELLSKNSKIVLLGEDIAFPYGGAFNITKDLSFLFEGRVLNMPISEQAMIGLATGLAIGGYLPIVEIMFGDFLTLTFDQLFNHACKFREMYNNNVEVPMVIRTPVGAYRGYGPTHSQSIEKFFLGFSDLNILAINRRMSPQLIYTKVYENLRHPILILENKVLYSKSLNINMIQGFDILFSDELFPSIKISPRGESCDVTIFCYGGILDAVEVAIVKAFFEDEILCEVICPTLIYPMNIDPILKSVSKTKKIITIEEGSNIASISSEIIATLTMYNVEMNSVHRMGNNFIIPPTIDNEAQVLPNAESIYNLIKMAYNEWTSNYTNLH